MTKIINGVASEFEFPADTGVFAQKIIEKENETLRKNAENNDKVVDKVNWENMLLKKENKQLKDNWNKLRKYINEANEDLYWTNNYDDILYVMQYLERGKRQ